MIEDLLVQNDKLNKEIDYLYKSILEKTKLINELNGDLEKMNNLFTNS